MKSAPPPGHTVHETIALTGYSERSIRKFVADGTLDVVRRGRYIYVTRESVARLREDLRSRRVPIGDLSEADREAIAQQVRQMAAMTPDQLTALGTLLAEIRLSHAARDAAKAR